MVCEGNGACAESLLLPLRSWSESLLIRAPRSHYAHCCLACSALRSMSISPRIWSVHTMLNASNRVYLCLCADPRTLLLGGRGVAPARVLCSLSMSLPPRSPLTPRTLLSLALCTSVWLQTGGHFYSVGGESHQRPAGDGHDQIFYKLTQFMLCIPVAFGFQVSMHTSPIPVLAHAMHSRVAFLPVRLLSHAQLLLSARLLSRSQPKVFSAHLQVLTRAMHSRVAFLPAHSRKGFLALRGDACAYVERVL